MSPTRSLPVEHRRTPRILVVDADGDTRLMYREWLQTAGSDVVDAVDGRDAMVNALSVRPTLVITELRLPIFDGFALCDVLRRDFLTKTVPIVIVTAESSPAEVDRARAAGANVVLIKPVTPEALLREIDRLLEDQAPPLASPKPKSTRPAAHRRVATPASQRRLAKKEYERLTTTTPPMQPPDLLCPSCDRPLNYQRSFVGGVSPRNAEQWDQFACVARCGLFEYRHRTRKMRRMA